MTNREFENYLALVSRLLRLKRGQTDQIAGELRDHLELRVAELVESGVEADEATRLALEEFGDAASLAGQFQFISETKQRRWMMRYATLSVAALFVVAVFTMAMWPDGARFGSPDRSVANDGSAAGWSSVVADDQQMSDATRRTNLARQALTTEYLFDFEETPFREVMDRLAGALQVTFILDYSAKDDSLTYDEPITFRTGLFPANKAFRFLLKDHNATYVIQGGIVRIISLDVAYDPEYFTRRIFDIEDLLSKIHDLESDRIGNFRLRATGGGSSHGGGGIFCIAQSEEKQDPAASESDASAPETTGSTGGGGFGGGGFGGGLGGGGTGGNIGEVVTAERLLMESIKNTIFADSWAETNGDGTIEIISGLMIVNQTEEANESIEELLQDMRFQFAQRKE